MKDHTAPGRASASPSVNRRGSHRKTSCIFHRDTLQVSHTVSGSMLIFKQAVQGAE